MVCLFEHFFQQTCKLRLNVSDLPAVQNNGAGDKQVVLNARIEQKGCQDVSGAVQSEILKKNLE
jgi:hypothetical protein